MAETLSLRGTLEGHTGWVTSIATPLDPNSDSILSASRDKTVIVWTLTKEDGVNYGYAKRRLTGHSHFVEDVVISQDGMYALSGSWDGTLRLWDLNKGISTRRFLGHKKDVLSVAFSADNRQRYSSSAKSLQPSKYLKGTRNVQIMSGSRDKTIKLWNTLAECKFTIAEPDGHTEWVSCVRFSPVQQNPVIVSAGWDRVVKVWNLTNCNLKSNLRGHRDYINTVTVSPDGSLCASGGKDGTAMLWDLADCKKLYSLEAHETIHALCFSPNRYWLCAATESAIKVWDLESKSIVFDLRPDFELKTKNAQVPYCVSLQWAADGQTLYSGYTDAKIRVWAVGRA